MSDVVLVSTTAEVSMHDKNWLRRMCRVLHLSSTVFDGTVSMCEPFRLAPYQALDHSDSWWTLTALVVQAKFWLEPNDARIARLVRFRRKAYPEFVYYAAQSELELLSRSPIEWEEVLPNTCRVGALRNNGERYGGDPESPRNATKRRHKDVHGVHHGPSGQQ